MNQKDTIAQLRADLHDEAQYMRLDAIQQLARIGTPDVLPALLEGLLHEDTFVGNIAADGLIEIGFPSVDALAAVLPQVNSKNSARILRVLGSIGNSRALPAMTPYLESTDHRVQHAAIDALAAIGDPAAIADLARLINAPEQETRQRVIAALSAIGGESAIRHLAHVLGYEPDAALRRDAALGIADHHHHAHNAIPALVLALGDTDGDVRAAATNALAMIGPPAIDALIEHLVTGNQIPQAAIGRALVTIGEAVIPVLSRLLHSDHYPMAVTAAVLLSEMGGEAVDILLDSLQSSQDTTRHAAALALENIPDARVQEVLQHYRSQLL